MRRPGGVLGTPVKDLGLTLQNSAFAPLLAGLRRELRAEGIRLQPTFYLSTEYGCLERTATIGLLWTDGWAWSKRLAGRAGVRTRDTATIRRTLRHEVGHAFCYAHRLYATARFRTLFGVRGSFFASYPEIWRAGPREHARVRRGEVILPYAARHADEDFAVSFEFWLTSSADGWDWRRRFRGKPVILSKLAYVEEVVRERGGRRPRVPVDIDEPVDEVRLTVREWLDSVASGTNYNLYARTRTGT